MRILWRGILRMDLKKKNTYDGSDKLLEIINLKQAKARHGKIIG